MRDEGYYWCFFDRQTGWVIGEWDGEHWTVHHSENELKDSDFDEIDERRIERDEGSVTRPEDSVTMIDIDGLPFKVIVDDSIPPDVMVFENKNDGSKTVRISLE